MLSSSNTPWTTKIPTILLLKSYGPATRIFIKWTELHFLHCWSMGRSFVNYVEVLHLQWNTYKLCFDYVMATFQIFRAMGLFYTQWSQNHPKQTIVGFWFIIFSINMTLSLTDEKKTKFKELSKDILSCTIVTIRKLAKLIGNLTVTFPAVTFGPFFVDM